MIHWAGPLADSATSEVQVAGLQFIEANVAIVMLRPCLEESEHPTSMDSSMCVCTYDPLSVISLDDFHLGTPLLPHRAAI